jgi:PAS domain S-box-containing protein
MAPLILSERDGVLEWRGALPRARALDPDSADATFRAAVADASCAFIDADQRDPLGAARRVHQADPAVQVLLVSAPERRATLERALLFAPGLGEVWMAEPATVDPDLADRYAAVTAQRRRYQKTRRMVEAGMARVEPRRDTRALVSDAYLAALLNVLPEPIVSLDEAGCVLSWNRAAEQIVGVPRHAAVGRPVDELLRPQPASDFEGLLRRGRRGEARGETEFRRATGERGIAEVAVVPVEAAGHHVRALVLHDVTLNRETQAELEAQAAEMESQAAEMEVLNEQISEHSRDLENALATRSRFYAAMSHELRTPINAIIGYNALILDGIFGPLEPKQHQGIERAQKAAQHLLELVNDVLDLSKIEAGRIELELESTDVPLLLHELLDTVRPMAEAQRTPVQVAEGQPCARVVTDPRRLRQILLNLLSNAIKFGGGNPVTIACTPAGEGVAVEVTDRGAGIAPEHQERIFEEFVQVERAPEAGTGLGLPISRKLAGLLGGSLHVRSAPGEGSTFRLELPARPPAMAETADALPPVAPLDAV